MTIKVFYMTQANVSTLSNVIFLKVNFIRLRQLCPQQFLNVLVSVVSMFKQ